MLLCQYCNREFNNAGAKTTHEPYCKDNPNRVQRKKSPNAHRKAGSVPWNKGIPMSTETKNKISKSLTGVSTGRASTDEKEQHRIEKIRSHALNSGLGGRVEGSGRGKKGWYKGIFCDSSWELAFVVYHIDNNLPIQRCKEVRWYEWEGKKKRYYPDFIVDGKVTEVKGYKTKQWEAKLNANPDVIVLYENDIKPYLDYVISKYGKDFITMYGEDRVAGQQSVLKTDPTSNG